MTDVERLVGEVGEAIDRAALDPTQWAGVLDAICDAFPGTRATIYGADTRDQSAIGVIQRGFEAAQMVQYEQRYAKINPWVPLLVRFPPLRPYISDAQLPSSSFRETEFYRDWLARVGDMDSAIGVKLVHEPDRIGVIAIHYAPNMAESYNPQIARVLEGSATRLRRAIDAVRLVRTRKAAAPMSLDAFALPAFLLDASGRVLDLNGPAQALVGAGGALSLGFDNTLRLTGPAALSERVVAVARQIAASRGPWRDGLDLPLTGADGSRLTMSMLAVREPATAGVPAFFVAPRLTLLLLRRSPALDAAAPAPFDQRLGSLTPAERRLALQLGSGHTLRQSANRLGIAYETARSQLKAVFDKTGTSRQAELVALLARQPPSSDETT
jgi:DNA-binding CsgD family transcriptional regulator